MYEVKEVDEERLIELHIAIQIIGSRIVVREYPPTPSGGPSKVLYHVKHQED